MTEENARSFKALGLIFLATPVLWVWSGVVVTFLWGWFIVPLGLDQIGLAHAIGLVIMISFLTKKININNDKEDPLSKVQWGIFVGITRPAFILIGGSVVRLFMGS